jgi:regulator of PEP synthase PpsR (kinase-PPPase family)
MPELSKRIVIVSDSTGETAEKVVRAVLAQFDTNLAAIQIFPRVRLEKEIEDIVERAAETGALLLHTMVNPDHREMIARLCADANVENVDLIGTLMGKLALFVKAEPRGVPGGMYKVNEDYFRRIEAVEFAVKNDDGQHPRNLTRADIVLVGISRTSKTPLSTYLAQRGFKCANVPIVKGIEPPSELNQVDQDKIFGLQIASDALFRIRQARLQQLGMPADTAYGMKDHIQREIDYAQQLFDANPHWPVLDVTDKAIEETAATLLAIRAQREERRRPH